MKKSLFPALAVAASVVYAGDAVFDVGDGISRLVAPETPVSLSGDGKVIKNGPGTLLWGISSLLTADYTGDTVVNGGTLRLQDGVPIADKWVRFEFIRACGHRFYGNDSWAGQFQLSEVCLFDAAGNRVNLGLSEVPSATEASALKPGEFTLYVPSGVDTHDNKGEYFFDGKETTWCATGWPARPDDASRHIIVTMRLADDVGALHSYNFISGGDSWNEWYRYPDDYVVWTSLDGLTWTKADEQKGLYVDSIRGNLVRCFPIDRPLVPAIRSVELPHGAGKGDLVLNGVDSRFDVAGNDVTLNAVRAVGKIVNTAARADEIVRIAVGADDEDSIFDFSCLDGGFAFAKIGAGTVTADGRVPKPASISVENGVLRLVAKSGPFCHYRFKVDAVVGSAAVAMQISEFELYDGNTNMTREKLLSASRSDSWVHAPSEGESPEKAVDGDLDTKFLDFNAATASGDWSDDAHRKLCWLQLDYSEPIYVTSYSWATASDCCDAGNPECRNPKDWRLQGSDDGYTWVDLDVVKGFTDSTIWRSFVTDGFPVRFDPSFDLSGTTLSVSGGELEIASPAKMGACTVGDGTVRLDDAAIWSVADGTSMTVCGPFVGEGAVRKDGAGTLVMGGKNNYSGDTMVAEGTLHAMRNGTSAKWIRVSIKKSVGYGYDSIVQLSELYLYDENGNRINQGLVETLAESCADLEPGEFHLKARVDTYSPVVNLFDGDSATKWCIGNWEQVPDDSDHWLTVTMRLKDDAGIVSAYNFRTGNDTADFPSRNPMWWSVEGSHDGLTWFALDEKRLSTNEPPAQNLVRFNGGVNYAAVDPDAKPIPADSPVAVAAGAVLEADEGVVIGALKIDCATGSGTITRFEPLANGSLYLENADGTEGYSKPFPISFGTVVYPSNAKTWKIYVNGTLVSNDGFRIGKDGKAYFRKGFVFVIH